MLQRVALCSFNNLFCVHTMSLLWLRRLLLLCIAIAASVLESSAQSSILKQSHVSFSLSALARLSALGEHERVTLTLTPKHREFSYDELQRIEQEVHALQGTLSQSLSRMVLVSLPIRRLSELAMLGSLCHISLSLIEDEPLSMNLSCSNQQSSGRWLGTNTDSVHALGYRGQGTIVGVVDLGFDIYNHDFRNPDNTTRIISLWHQGGTGTPPTGFTFGAEYSSADINTLSVSVPNNAHGTACLGIAAGNGRASGQAGIAPEADIMLVILANTIDTSVIRAFTYLKQKAAALGKPISISYSYGSNFGAHDGSRSTELAISSLAGAGTLFSIAGGNNGGANVHIDATMPPSAQSETSFTTGNNNANGFSFYGHLWYPGSANVTVSLIAPDNTQYGPFGLSPTVQVSLPVRVYHNTYAPNGDKEIQFVIENRQNEPGWRVRLNNLSLSAVPYDGWRVHGGFWTSNQNDYRSLTTPSTADSAICVVSYDVSSGNRDASSSLGLTRNNQLKPEVSAPTNVTTTNGLFGGTSASAPHLAGLGALLLQANPLLSTSQLRALLADSSRRDIATGTIPPHRIDWGHGKMYALGAFQAALPKSGQSLQITRTGNFIWNDLSGKYGAFLNFASEDIDQVTVEIYPNTTPSSIGSAKAVQRRVVITSSGGSGIFNATLRLYYDDVEVAAGGLSEGNLKLYRFNGSNWELQGGTNNTVDNYVELSGVTAFSEWAIADPSDNPLPVELISFTGVATPAGVRLSWSTASERNNAGFEILRTVQTPNEPQAWQMIASYAFSPDLRGKGTSTSLTHYAFLDATVEGGKTYTYKLHSRDFNGAMHDYAPRVTVEVRNVLPALPTEYRLEQNYPNPFNPSTIIVYDLPKASQVSLKVYDMLGREVATLVNANQAAGRYRVVFSADASSLSAGVYFYVLSASGFQKMRKMLLVK